MIHIVDYGVGNIGALLNMFDYLGIDAQSSGDPKTISSSRKLILPGVGSFDKAMSTLRSRGLVEALHKSVVEEGATVLGICLGMQLFARRSEEGSEPGLNCVPGDVKRIPLSQGGSLRVPHIGWTNIKPVKVAPLFPTMSQVERFYFVHSYYMCCDDPTNVSAVIEYGEELCCAVACRNILGVQFHPEKSHRFGMRLLRSFAEL